MEEQQNISNTKPTLPLQLPEIDIEDELIVSRKLLARALSLSVTRIDQLTTEGVIKRVARGKFDLASSVKNYIDYKENKFGNDSDIDEAKLKAQNIKNERDSLLLEKEKGMLVDKQRQDSELFTLGRQIRDNMMQIAHSVAPSLAVETDPNIIQVTLEKEIRQVLQKFAEN